MTAESRTASWYKKNLNDLTGKVAIVTGANTGLGCKTSMELARKGAEVVMGCRQAERGERAASRLRSEVRGATVRVIELDLVDPIVTLGEIHEQAMS